MPSRRFRPSRRAVLGLGAAWLAAAAPAARDRFFIASDGTRLHYLEAGPAAGATGARTLVLIPGWTMPAWIFGPQIDAFSRRYRVVAFDPRAQGASDVARSGYDHIRRAQDITELLAHLGPGPIAVLAWSLAVLETLAYTRAEGDGRLDGLILVDNSVGEEPPPPAPPPRRGPKPPHAVEMREFVHGMFRHPQPAAYLDRLTRATLRVPEPASRALLAYPVPRSYWREAIYAVSKPILYVVRPKFAGQAGNIARKHPAAETVVLGNDVGHALFVDDPARFDRLVLDFLARKVWP